MNADMLKRINDLIDACDACEGDNSYRLIDIINNLYMRDEMTIANAKHTMSRTFDKLSWDPTSRAYLLRALINARDMSQLWPNIEVPIMCIHSSLNGFSGIKNPESFLNAVGSKKKVMRVIDSPHNIFEYAQDTFTSIAEQFMDMIKDLEDNKPAEDLPIFTGYF
jgi:hypothetical protein